MPLMRYLSDQSLINISFSSYLWFHFFQLFTIPFLSFIYMTPYFFLLSRISSDIWHPRCSRGLPVLLPSMPDGAWDTLLHAEWQSQSEGSLVEASSVLLGVFGAVDGDFSRGCRGMGVPWSYIWVHVSCPWCFCLLLCWRWWLFCDFMLAFEVR